MSRHEDRVLGFLSQRPAEAVTVEEIARATQLPEPQLKGVLGQMTKNGGKLQRIGQNSYMYSKAPLPRLGETFSAEVVGISFSGGTIVRDATGASWKIEPV